MTPDELARQQARANYLRQQQSQADILRKSAMTPEALAEAIRLSGYDPQGKEQMLATMLRGGQDALFSEGPRGKQVGGIYVAPTWSESLNSAVQKGLGGYQMGQARKEQTSIDDQRAAASSAEAQVAAEQARARQLADAEKAIMSTMDSQSDDDRAERQMAQAAELAGLARAAADARAARQTPAQIRAEAEDKRRAERDAKADAENKRRAERDAKADAEKLETKTRALANKLDTEGVTDTKSSLNAFWNTVKPFEIKDEKGNPTGEYSDIPGLGGVANILGGPGDLATTVGDAWNKVTGQEKEKTGMNVRQAYTNVLNQKVKDISGGAVPVAEWMRNQAAAGYSMWSEEMNAIDGMKEIEKALLAKEQNIRAGAGDETIANYERQKAREAPGAPKAEGVPDGIDPALWKAMTPEEKALWK
jgi:hypothetical protein